MLRDETGVLQCATWIFGERSFDRFVALLVTCFFNAALRWIHHERDPLFPDAMYRFDPWQPWVPKEKNSATNDSFTAHRASIYGRIRESQDPG